MNGRKTECVIKDRTCYHKRASRHRHTCDRVRSAMAQSSTMPSAVMQAGSSLPGWHHCGTRSRETHKQAHEQTQETSTHGSMQELQKHTTNVCGL